jgi:Tol biopolymer transport system component
LISIVVATGDVAQLTMQGDSIFPRWSPDGTRIAFVRLAGAGRGIYVMDADGSNLIQLTSPDRPLRDHDMFWSPDSGAIVFTRGYLTEARHLGDVYVVPVTGGEPQLVISDSIAAW